jgi:hypothetical protein
VPLNAHRYHSRVMSRLSVLAIGIPAWTGQANVTVEEQPGTYLFYACT